MEQMLTDVAEFGLGSRMGERSGWKAWVLDQPQSGCTLLHAGDTRVNRTGKNMSVGLTFLMGEIVN